jgi:hypothetical protein
MVVDMEEVAMEEEDTVEVVMEGVVMEEEEWVITFIIHSLYRFLFYSNFGKFFIISKQYGGGYGYGGDVGGGYGGLGGYAGGGGYGEGYGGYGRYGADIVSALKWMPLHDQVSIFIFNS